MLKRVGFLCVLVVFLNAQWTPDPMCPYPSEGITRYPYPGNCSVFWACFDGNKFLVECPEGLEFDTVTGECQSPDVAQCDSDASTTTSTSSTQISTDVTSSTVVSSTEGSTTEESTIITSTEASSTTDHPYPYCPPNSNESFFLPYQGDCGKYWECFEGSSYLYSCPEGLWWHPEITQCDYPGDYCDDSTTTKATTGPTQSTITTSTEISTDTTGSSQTTQNPNDITCPVPNDSPVYFPYEGDCSKYWECFEGVIFLNSCPSGLWWHQEVSKCGDSGDVCEN